MFLNSDQAIFGITGTVSIARRRMSRQISKEHHRDVAPFVFLVVLVDLDVENIPDRGPKPQWRVESR